MGGIQAFHFYPKVGHVFPCFFLFRFEPFPSSEKSIKGKRLVTNIRLLPYLLCTSNHKNIRKNQSLPQVSLCSAACLYLCLCIKKNQGPAVLLSRFCAHRARSSC